ncbi:MAG: vitamin B12-dependent ribonucleotide reductase [Parcubacteria group bacterium]
MTRSHTLQNPDTVDTSDASSERFTSSQRGEGLTWKRIFGSNDPYDAISWEKRNAKITRGDGSVVFEQLDIEVPEFWSQTAIDIVASKYFRGKLDTPERETSARAMVDRVANTISGWGFKDGYFKTQIDYENFKQDLKYLLINQFAAFNSPVWFNVGVYERPQCSACFILAVEDTMESILKWYHDEGWIFKYGSGSGANLSKLRSSQESLSRGGKSSGPVSFMKGADGVANSIRSGGTTRRAAKMVVLNADHPDIKDFIYCKRNIEDMVKVLEASGVQNSIEGDLFDPYTLLPYQNANNSVRVTDEFMKAVESDADWNLNEVTTGNVAQTLKAGKVMDWIADAAWHSADPGMQFDTIINDWHTCPNSGRINASNPCSEYMSLDNSACNLASINLLKFLKEDGTYDIEGYKNTAKTMITAQEILISNSSYPTPEIEKTAHDFRQLGLGYANLGALLMALGLPYDSDEGRTIAAALTSIMSGEAYRMSAVIAGRIGPFNGYEMNRNEMLRVIKKHGRAAETLAQNYRKATDTNGHLNGNGNGVSPGVARVTMNGSTPTVTLSSTTDIVLMNSSWVSDLIDVSEQIWKNAYALGEQYGFRNSQATVLAPTGTISFLMDCATTGIEPELALVKYKKLVGGGTLKLVNNLVPLALEKLGYEEQDIKDISAYILEKGMLEGAPHMKEEDMPVFDCSFKPAEGKRSIDYLGHIKMMSAAQPFISGAISKTINLPNDATKEDVRDAFVQSWKLGLKAMAIYRDGSKTVQALSTSDKEKKLVEQINGHTRIKLPDERPSITHKFTVGKHEGYITVGMYPESRKPAETFITIAKEGSTVSGLMDAIAKLTSICLQSGVPLKTLVRHFKNMRFEPMGPTQNNEIPFSTSFVDYIFTYLGFKFLSAEDQKELFGKILNGKTKESSTPTATLASTSKKDDPWNLKVEESHTDAPTCECGTIMFRAGSCYSCPNCFATTGVCN